MVPDDPVCDRKSQTRSAGVTFGCKERIFDALHHVRRHADAFIGHLYKHAVLLRVVPGADPNGTIALTGGNEHDRIR